MFRGKNKKIAVPYKNEESCIRISSRGYTGDYVISVLRERLDYLKIPAEIIPQNSGLYRVILKTNEHFTVDRAVKIAEYLLPDAEVEIENIGGITYDEIIGFDFGVMSY